MKKTGANAIEAPRKHGKDRGEDDRRPRTPTASQLHPIPISVVYDPERP